MNIFLIYAIKEHKPLLNLCCFNTQYGNMADDCVALKSMEDEGEEQDHIC
jgi:hypothetical protein